MRDIVIETGVYGRRTESDRVLPVTKGERATLSDEEAARLVSLGVAAYADAPAQPPGAPPVPTPDGQEEPGASQDTPGGDTPAEGSTDGREAAPYRPDVARLERMQKADLEQMAADMGVDISGAKTKHDMAVLIAAADEADRGEAPPDLDAGDIVQ